MRSHIALALVIFLLVPARGALAKSAPLSAARGDAFASSASSASPRAALRAPAATVRSAEPGGWTIETDIASGGVVFAARNPAALAATPAARALGGAPRARATEADARRALAAWAPRLSIPERGEALALAYERHGLARDVFVFEQRIDGLPVLGAEVGITLWNGEPMMIFSGYAPESAAAGEAGGGSRSSRALVTSEHASRAVVAALAASAAAVSGAPIAAAPRAEPVWYRSATNTLERGYTVRLVTADPPGDWIGVVDAASGAIVLLENDARYADAPETRGVRRANAIGRVFHPSPVVSNRDLTLVDLLDEDQAAFDTAYSIVELRDLEFAEGAYNLRGPYVEIVDLSPPSIDPPAPAESLFLFTRSQDAFEAVNAYYHADRAQRYIQSLGFDGVAAFPVKLDVHGLGDQDNSLYTPSEKSIRFGDGCVDDAEDADVIYHEYGHAIQDDQVPGWGFAAGTSVTARSIGEGWGDYWASSVAAQIGGGFDDAQVFDWDRNPGAPCWLGRRVDTALTMDNYNPSTNLSGIYTNGMIWSAALWEIRAAIGAGATDRLAIESHFGLPPNTTYEQNATSFALADVTLYGGANLPLVLAAFEARGIEVDTTSLGPDSLSPNLTVAVLQNPVLTAYIDVVVLGSEPLLADSLSGEIGGAPLAFAPQDDALRRFRAEHRLTESGVLSIIVVAEDLAGNEASVTRGFSAAMVARGAETRVASPDGALALEIGAGALAEETWVILGDGDRVEGGADGGADAFEYALGPAGRALAAPARVTLARAPDGGSLDGWTLALAGAAGVPPARVDLATGVLALEIPRLATIVARKDASLPGGAGLAALRLHPAWPNPTAGPARIAFDLAAPQRVRLGIYAVTGERVRSLFEGSARAGASAFAWDGKDDLGRAVASGVYLLRVEGERASASRKLVVTR